MKNSKDDYVGTCMFSALLGKHLAFKESSSKNVNKSAATLYKISSFFNAF